MDFVTVVTSGETMVHFPSRTGMYATMCDMDGDDNDPSSQQKVVPTKLGAKVNCPHCIAIWEFCQQFSRNEISWREYNSRK
jgi:hypothetical protein